MDSGKNSQSSGDETSNGRPGTCRHHTSKTGRKGDPRMHRAVAARLENPRISLFDALRIGGFQYATDEDSNVIDSEDITLGQRKNQLSRRLRLARQQLEEEEASPSSVKSTSEVNETQRKLRFLLQQQQNQLSGKKRSYEDQVLAEEAEEEEAGTSTSEAEEPDHTHIMAKFHPKFNPMFIPHMTGTLGNPQQAFAPNGVSSSVLPPPLSLEQQTSLGSLLGGLLQQPEGDMFPFAPSAGLSTGVSGLPRSVSAEVAGQIDCAQRAAALSSRGVLPQAAAFTDCMIKQQHQGADGQAAVTLQNQGLAAQQQFLHHTSGVAITSLAQTAASVGLTLEQLALLLRSGTNLPQIVASSKLGDTRIQENLAVALYHNENHALYKRAMLMAGFPIGVVQDDLSEQHLQFATRAWREEGKRLEKLVNERNARRQSCTDPPLEANMTSKAAAAFSASKAPEGTSTTAPVAAAVTNGSNEPAHDHQHEHGHNCALEEGRHQHRLEGKCGHKAILHQPTDGNAHIDFLVGNRIECYEGVQAISHDQSSNVTTWPSKYKCEDLSCPDTCADQVIDLEDIDFQGKEWNSDFSNGESLLGLFKLGSGEASRSSAAASPTELNELEEDKKPGI